MASFSVHPILAHSSYRSVILSVLGDKNILQFLGPGALIFFSFVHHLTSLYKEVILQVVESQ